MRTSVYVALAIMALGCGGSAAAETGAVAGSLPGAYHILPGDVLSITVWGEDSFSQVCQVNGSGTISYPLLGDVPAAGETCAGLEAGLGEGLGRYLRQPQVSVTVKEYGALGMSVFVLGEVQSPGIYPLAGSSGLGQALAAAGGATRQASGQVTIVRARTGEMHSSELEQALAGLSAGRLAGTTSRAEARLEPGDVIVVDRKPEADRDRRYAVLGEVPTPGMFEMPLEGEVRVLDAMEKAGLLARSSNGAGGGAVVEELIRTADLERALLSRGDVMVPLNLMALLQGDTSQNLLLQAGDVLMVPRRVLINVYVLGEVRTPGRQALPPGTTVLDLLNAVGGVSSTAKLHEATLLRLVEGQPTSLPVDLNKLLRQADAKENLTLQEGDVLFVPTRGEQGRDLWSMLPLLPYLAGR